MIGGVPLVGGVPPARGDSSSRAGSANFQIPQDAAESVRSPAVTSAGGVSVLSAMLTLQEVEPPQERNRRARKLGEKRLALLARLQAEVLGSGPSIQLLIALQELSADSAIAHDPGLREVLDGIALRCAVEQERLSQAMQRSKPA